MGGFLGNAFGASKHMGSQQVPPYQGLAEKQSQSTRPNWNGPAGGQTWTMDPNTHQMSMNVTSPYQGAFDALKNPMQSAAGMDPAQARNQAINQNLDFGMSRLNPMFAQQNKTFDAQQANMGLDPGTEGYNEANRQLGVRQSDAFGNMVTNAVNQGNETQRTQIAQQMVPFQQLGQLTNATYAHPYMGEGVNYMDAAKAQYEGDRNNIAADMQNYQNTVNSWNRIPSTLGGKGKGGGGGGGGGMLANAPTNYSGGGIS